MNYDHFTIAILAIAIGLEAIWIGNLLLDNKFLKAKNGILEAKQDYDKFLIEHYRKVIKRYHPSYNGAVEFHEDANREVIN